MTARPSSAEAALALLRAGDGDAFLAHARELEPADLADVLAALDEEERVTVVESLPADLVGPALPEMPHEAHAEDTLAALPADVAAEIVEEMDDDDAADLLAALDPEDQERILAEVEHRSEVDRLLRYDEATAGGRMTRRLVTVLDTDTVERALDAIRRQVQAEQMGDYHEIFVVDRFARLRGVLPVRELVISPPDRPVAEFMDEAMHTVAPDLEQGEVARVLSRYNLAGVPVVDPEGRLLGAVTFDDVLDVMEAENTEDLLQFGGTSPDEELAAGWREAVRSRLPWLLVNLVTAFVAKAVIDAQQGVIDRLPLLAAWLGVIAGMGGNAGTQALAVTVRRLALGMIGPGDGVRIIGKELLVGLINGVANGIVVALVAWLTVGHGAMLGLVVLLAMIGNLVVAGASGAMIPLLLERFGVDPAIASSIFVTTFTDVFGFGLVLLFARLLLLS